MSTETTKKKIKIDNGTEFARVYTDKEVDSKLTNKQDTLVSGTNIKTLNGQSILGSGDMAIGGGGGISVIELTDINGTIASTQLSEINANPQNFAFKYNERILLFSRASSTTYQYCKNTTNSSENNVITVTTLLTIELSTGNYTIAENAHNVVANSTHPANGGDLTNIQVGSKVYSIPSGGGGGQQKKYYWHNIVMSKEDQSSIVNFGIITTDESKYTSITQIIPILEARSVMTSYNTKKSAKFIPAIGTVKKSDTNINFIVGIAYDKNQKTIQYATFLNKIVKDEQGQITKINTDYTTGSYDAPAFFKNFFDMVSEI